MKVFFAGVESLYEKNLNLVKDGYNLISYYSINKKVPEIIHNSRALLLDSGAYTLTSQIIDTVIFIGIGFGIGMKMGGGELIGLMIGQYCVKFILAALDTPIFYLSTRQKKEVTSHS